MGVMELLLLAVGLSMDAFAVSVCKGLAMKKPAFRGYAACGLWFGGFQALMPLLGYYMGAFFADSIRKFDHWVAFALLVLIGVNMLREAADHSEKDREEQSRISGDTSALSMFVLAIATSIDAFAVGISLAMSGNVNIWLAIAVCGAVTCLLSGAGVKVGNVFGSRYEKKAEAAGGIILVLLGVKILAEHLGVLA